MNLSISALSIGAAVIDRASLTTGGMVLSSVGMPYTLVMSAVVSSAVPFFGSFADDEPVVDADPPPLLLSSSSPHPAATSRTRITARTPTTDASRPPLARMPLSSVWFRPDLSSDRKLPSRGR
jgi:hypothetical protein